MSSEFKVKLHIYDVSRGIAKQMSPLLLGKQIDGIWHTGIVIYEKEFFFGSDGIDYCLPCGTHLGAPDEIKDMGSTQIPEDIFQQYLIELSEKDFRPECYNLFEHNCNTFSNEATQFLTGRTIPKYIQELPKDVLNTPFGAMIKPIFDSMSVRPNVGTLVSDTTASPTNPQKNSEPQPTTSSDDSGSLISDGPTLELQQSKNAPVIIDNYKVSSIVSSLEKIIEKGELTEPEVQHIWEIVNALKSEQQDELNETHLELLESLLEKYEHTTEVCILTSIIQTLSLLVLQDHIISIVCQDSVSRPLFRLAREFPQLNPPDVQNAVVELLTNICSTDAGCEVFVTKNQGPGAKGDLKSSSNDTQVRLEHHETAVDHRDVIEVTVKAILDGGMELLKRAAGLVYNISMAKVSEESALECSSAILECLQRDNLDTNTVYHCLFALTNFMKISSEVVNLTSLIGIKLSKFVQLSKPIEEICSQLEQYLMV
ncbi:uncharacterized protein LOC114535989 [Dendronephthya gigantea]|uniref:uncharacterized protein LOC114535989 n=1 Tax=Dendronephthya gigantea TaxID=151771 RepID=UPI001069503F|nr:uncharacterized protein LOC114535989 [Dendronephthya gigantea]